jgi:hypothetical protein
MVFFFPDFPEMLSKLLILWSYSHFHYFSTGAGFSGFCYWCHVTVSIFVGKPSQSLFQIHCWYIVQNEQGQYLERIFCPQRGWIMPLCLIHSHHPVVWHCSLALLGFMHFQWLDHFQAPMSFLWSPMTQIFDISWAYSLPRPVDSKIGPKRTLLWAAYSGGGLVA